MKLIDLVFKISIHAPAKGATRVEDLHAADVKFQSTLPRRERPPRSGYRRHDPNFNPRSREGSDPISSPVFFLKIFQSTLPRRERLSPINHGRGSCGFQSTLPRRERRLCCGYYIEHIYFNPRSREGSDYNFFERVCDIFHFNPRSREGSDGDRPERCEPTDNFNPRSREGSDQDQRMTEVQEIYISIHAPAKGATESDRSCWGLTEFQSTLPRRERRIPKATKYGFNNISIHAPAKGATQRDLLISHCSVFQSTLPRRERLYHIPIVPGKQRFQSTLPRRERPPDPSLSDQDPHFNPRSREGSDPAETLKAWGEDISIHAPAKGATAFINIFSLAVRLFFISSHQ